MVTTKVAIMQPYVFPYVGYMNLVGASDKFVFYDDVHFIKKGWINRNCIVLMQKPYRFSIPLKAQSQNILIKDTELVGLSKFANKFLKQLESSYKNAIYRKSVLDYVREVLNKRHENISDLAVASVELFFKYIGIEKDFHSSSKDFSSTQGLGREERLIKITQLLDSSRYINPIGGASLYKKNFFLSKGITLEFVKPSIIPYQHCNASKGTFYPGLSIIDIMMNLSIDELKNQIMSYELF